MGSKSKVSSSLMNEMVEGLKEMGIELSEDHINGLREKNIVSSGSRGVTSYKIEDGDGVLYSVNLSFKTMEKGHKLKRTKQMDELVEWFNKEKLRFLHEVTTTIPNPTMVSG
jgi:hypothetical protein|tara:strand:+ start:290 stop:625 length:336 start_codon:yes stop_codon:yes gene_type:complete